MYRIPLAGRGVRTSECSAFSPGVQPPPAPWRGAGPTPCVGSDGGIFQCPPAPRVIAIRAGRMFNSKTGQMLTKQVVVLAGERITEVGPEGQVKIPAGSAGDRPQPGDRPARPDRRAYAHVQHARPEGDHGSLHADRRAERAGRPAGGLHHRARHELARQWIRRHRDPRRHQPGPHRRPALSGVDARHRVGSHASEP